MKAVLKVGIALVAGASLLLAVPLIREYRAELHEEQEEKLEQDGMELAMHQRFLMTRDPLLNEVPTNRLLEAMRQRTARIASGRTAVLNWEERGPLNVGGRTRAMFVDNRDATGNTVFAGSVSGGIWKTTNFLSATPSWTPVAEKMGNLAVTCMWQSRTNGNVMLAGTGEGWFNVDAVRGAGIFRSTDGGITWNQLPSTTEFEYCQDVVMDNNNNIYVSLRNYSSTNRGVMRSTDNGSTWEQVVGAPIGSFTTGRAADMEVASNGDLYVTLGIMPDYTVTAVSIWRSAATNGANTGAVGTWVDVTPPGLDEMNRIELAVAPSNPQRLYAIMANKADGVVSLVYRSDNAGATWTSFPAPGGLNNGAVSQGWYNLTLDVDPNNPDVVAAGAFNVCRSTNGGANWSTLTSSLTVHVDQHIVLYSGSSRLLVGNDGGIFVSNDAGAPSPTFENKTANYNVTQFYGADLHPTNTNLFIAGAQDNNTHRFTTAGLNSGNAVVGGDGGIPHIDQTVGSNLVIASYVFNNFYRSLNGGSTFSPLTATNNNNGQFITPSDLDDAAKTLYAGEAANKYYVLNNLTGAPARLVNTVAAMGGRSVTAVRVDPATPNTVWLGCSFGSAKPQLLKLTNANTATPTVAVNVQITASLANATISSIEIDPANPAHILVSLSNYGIVSLFESTNNGSTFTAVEGDLPDMPVYWSLFVPNTMKVVDGIAQNGGVLIGTDLGIYYTTATAGNATIWTPYANFPNTPVYQMKLRNSDRTLLAATHGRGLWTANLPVATGVSNVTATRGFIRYISSMNDRLTIMPGTLTGVRSMSVEVYDSRGAVVLREARNYQSVQLSLTRLTRGAYTVRITGDKGEVFVQQVIK
ncbi:MAG: T9SS type A sorting domain-containing protein [Chitinophagaceae bacterium]|nr:MAG: T9SS type A sorting domain-containing protein [Chitinophagaceae bacterium]